jgi:hypothetical protein
VWQTPSRCAWFQAFHAFSNSNLYRYAAAMATRRRERRRFTAAFNVWREALRASRLARTRRLGATQIARARRLEATSAVLHAWRGATLEGKRRRLMVANVKRRQGWGTLHHVILQSKHGSIDEGQYPCNHSAVHVTILAST